ncbi:MAG: YdhR family protein [Acidobacteria bacterium]|nr:YdhR family protein [Acidobacteriota bacterium]
MSKWCVSLADVPGCLWKVWLINEKEREAGGIYLFADEASVEKFKGTPLVSSVLNHPALSEFSIKQFDVLESVSRVTRPACTSRLGLARNRPNNGMQRTRTLASFLSFEVLSAPLMPGVRLLLSDWAQELQRRIVQNLLVTVWSQENFICGTSETSSRRAENRPRRCGSLISLER